MQIKRLFDILAKLKAEFPQDDILNAKENGKWRNYSVDEFIETVDLTSMGLMELGMGKDDSIANMSPNRPEWNFIDFAMLQIGAKHVPLYPTLSEKDLEYILNDSETKIVFVASEDLYLKIKSVQKNVKSLKHVYSYEEIKGVDHWTKVRDLGKKGDIKNLQSIKDSINEEDLATLIYTSGTTGEPKGVMLTHKNIASNVIASSRLVPELTQHHKALSFLPLSHIFERMVVYMYLNRGISVYYAESLETIGDNLKEIKPHMFTTVPRLLEKVFDKIVGKGHELTGVKKALFFWALNLGLKFGSPEAEGFMYKIQLKLANKIIFPKWREALGGRILAIVSGGAALQPRLARVFNAGGIPVLQGYGLTETSPVIAVSLTEKGMNPMGTVGPVVDGVQVKIAEDGEILCKGPNVMKGYYKKPEKTAEVIDKDGWFHTGDIGEFYQGKFLKITDRKKEMFKTAGGKYIAPQPLENKFKESKFIEQVLVVGEGEKFPGAFIVPSFDVLKDWCKIKGIEYTSNEEMIKHPKVIDKFHREIDILNEGFGQWEKVKKIELMPREWTIDKGEMTPKLSLKRKNIIAANQEALKKIYSDSTTF